MLKPGSKIKAFETPAMIDGANGTLKWQDYAGKWTVLFFYPFDFTGVCSSELTAFNESKAEFDKRGVSILGASCDSVFSHLAWCKAELGALKFPVIGDMTKKVTRRFGVLNKKLGCPGRAAFIIDPEGIVRSVLANDLPVGRNTHEVLRLIDAFQSGQACLVNWQPDAA